MAFPDNKNYVLGRGKLYFAQFTPGTRVKAGGFEYFGNTPEFNTTSETETLDHFDSDNGIRVKDASVILELNRTGSFVTDHISPANLAKWFYGTNSVVTQAALTSVTQVLTNARRGNRYQVGESSSNPSGVRGLTSVTASVTTTTPVPLVEGTDYTVNLATGSFTILSTTALVSAAGTDQVTLTYSGVSSTYNRVTSGSNSQVEGALFFEATNPVGLRFDYTFPYVQLSPDGDFALKGDEWQQLGFTFEALKLNDTTETVYINGRSGEGV